MRLHRFITDCDLAHSPLAITDTAILHQWQKVLRLKTGDTVILCDGKNTESEATLESLDGKHAKLRLLRVHSVEAEPDRYITLYCSVLKRENFEWVVQKCTEIGAKHIIPIIAERTVKTGLKMERLRIIAKEAAEQSGRGMVPIISEPMNFSSALYESKNNECNVIFHTSAATNYQLPTTNSAGLWIGPEGGWSEGEVQQAQEHGFQMSSLGKLVLRAETAAITATFCLIKDELILPR